MEKKERTAVTLYKRYEYLAQEYAAKLYDYGYLGMTRDDVMQEMKEKIWYSILKFAKRWAKFRETGKTKPVPLPYYLRHNLQCVVIDLSRRINGYSVLADGTKGKKVCGMTSIEETNFDMGYNMDPLTFIDLQNNKAVVRGVDLLTGLNDLEQKAFVMHMKGHKSKVIQSVCRGVDVNQLIVRQTAFLETRKSELLGAQPQLLTVFSTESDD